MRFIAAAIVCFSSLLAYAEAPPHATFGPSFVGYHDVIRVDIDTECNVFAVDYHNYQNYLEGRSFTYYGGQATSSPKYITPPMGNYYVIIDAAGGSIAGIRAGVHVISR